MYSFSPYVNSEECAVLPQLPLGEQCKVLFIVVHNRSNIADLVKTVSKLRVLDVVCDDDKYHTNQLLSLNDELLHCLSNYLSLCIRSTKVRCIRQSYQ